MRDVPEWIGKTDNTAPPASVKDRILRRQDYRCALTGREFMPGDKIEFDHRTALWLGGENREGNLQAVIGEAHRRKTATEATVKAKLDRIRAKHFGLKTKKPFPGGRGSKWKKKVGGMVVPR